MNRSNKLCYTTWECKYHIVWIPKCRRKVLYDKVRKYYVNIIHELARQKECKIIEGHLCVDHVHMCIEIPPKYSVSSTVGYIKGKSAIAIARDVQGRAKNFVGQSFLAQGYFVFTVGRDEATIREYIKNQEKEDSRLEQLSLLK